MRTVFKIFANDISSVGRRFFALAIIVAISVLPALYAWVNIYANGNPYANTGSIKIAVASRDPGLDLDDGTHIDMTEEIFEELKTSDKIGWQFPETADEAIEGVRSGEYYAAVIFEDNFTYNMYHFEQAMLDEKAPITYYENQKANAIAPKITQTAATTLQGTIKTKYLETVFGLIFDETNDIADELSDGDMADDIIDQLKDLRDTLLAYDSAVSSFSKNSSDVLASLNSTRSKLSKARSSASTSAAKAKADLAKAKKSVEALEKALDAEQIFIQKDIDTLIDRVNEYGGILTDDEKTALEEEIEQLRETLKSDIENMSALFPDAEGSALTDGIKSTLENMIDSTESLEDLKPSSEAYLTILQAISLLNNNSLSASIDSLVKTLDVMLTQLEPLTSSISIMLDDIDPVFGSAAETIEALDVSLAQMQKVFRSAADRIDDIIDKVESVSDDERLDLLIQLLGGDPELYAKFFSSLVNVEVEEVYSVASYGAAMAPFYSVLAVWVGGVILVSILKTHIDRKKFPEATEAEAFFGRFLLFFLVGQAQAAVIVAGDIFLLGCAPVHPWLMWLAAAVTSLVFVMLIYALTLSFGDIGKAIVVVVMVLQIAGSSGSYPIEILPVIFSKGYKFFPFPYAINAMREALCGTYGNDYWMYLACLLIFGVVALLIGLLVRKPFIGMNDFVSEKIEETEVL